MMQIKHNTRPLPRTANDIKYIVIHDTANKCVKANAAAHFTYFNDADRQASADFFVDSLGSLQVNDYFKNFTWHVGDGHGKHGITNQNSIGVEICINADGDYMTAVHNTIILVRQLKKILPAAKVVRHYDASRKPCPGTMMANNWSGWDYFVKEVNAYPAPGGGNSKEGVKVEEKKIEVPQWKKDTAKWLKDNGYTDTIHNPLENVDIGTLGAILQNMAEREAKTS